ncbi:alpha/beta hydrolase [Nocardia jejuensis]|uniref:alpha/beta hydrolase n=1 Tax=Nocardia jejuensis TaxID=328049 RepID=UPI000835CD34|nr:alpha/beta hydrolase [Nocardia jejuensis]
MTVPATTSQAYAIAPETLTPQIAEWTITRDAVHLHLDRVVRDYAASDCYWVGAAGDRARTCSADIAGAGGMVADALTAAIAAATAGQAKIASARRVAIAAIDLTRRQKFEVAEDGTVTAPDATLSLPGEATADDITKAQAALDYRAKHVYEPPIKQALVGLGQVLEDTAADIDRAFDGIGDTKALATTQPVSLGERSRQVQDVIDGKSTLPADPRAFHDYWVTLGDEDKNALWQHDRYLGNHDGMPALDRDHYNRLTLDEEMTRATAAHNEVAQLTAQHSDWAKYTGTSREADSWLATRPGYVEWKTRLDDAQRRAKSYDDLSRIDEIVHDGKHPGRMLLSLDSQTGERVHTVVADGNPDAATHVTTYVPGTGSRPAKMGPDMERVDAMSSQAKAAGARTPVTIAWLGYDSPPALTDATDRKYADAAALGLDRFQEGLRVTHEGDPSRNTVLGHSYGTTVVGDAAGHGRTLNADAVVLVASPGTTLDHAVDFTLTDVPDGQEYLHVFATKAANDPVPLYSLVSGVPGTDSFGPDPTGTRFGAQVFTSDPGTPSPVWGVLPQLADVPGYSPSAHSEYWAFDSKSLINMGHIIVGNLEKVNYE